MTAPEEARLPPQRVKMLRTSWAARCLLSVVTLVGDLLVHDARQLARALLDRAVDVLHRHVGVAGLEQERAQAGVAGAVAAAGLRCERDVAREAREDLALARVGDGLEPLDLGPLVMTGHGSRRRG